MTCLLPKAGVCGTRCLYMYKKPLNARAHVHQMEIALKDGHCNVCYKAVSAHEHGLLCDLCEQWVHRCCGTGVSLDQYRDMCCKMRRGVEVPWICLRCAATPKGVPQSEGIMPQSEGISLTSMNADDSLAPVMESMRLDTAHNATPT